MVNQPTKSRSKRRWVQFSLRTGFIVVTALCVGLSNWVVPAERQRRAVEVIKALDGHISYMDELDMDKSYPIAFLRRWLPQDYIDPVKHVSLSGTHATDATLAQLRGLKRLKTLWLVNTHVTDAGLRQLLGLTNLQGLSLANTQVTDAGMTHLQGLRNLQTLFLNNTQVTDSGLTRLQGLASLRWINLKGTRATDTGVAELGKALPKCEIIGL